MSSASVQGLPSSPALAAVNWILRGLAGEPGWGTDAAAVLSPAFTAAIQPLDYPSLVSERARSYAPLRVLGIDVDDSAALARISDHRGGTTLLSCTVEDTAPHRIVSTWFQPAVPTDVAPRLPMDFSSTAVGTGDAATLTVFSGLPGSGKSTLADQVGRRLGIAVFSIDWLQGALTPFGGKFHPQLFDMGYELLTTLAFRQLHLGQSAILDAPTEAVELRDRWRSLAAAAGARFRVVVCTCPDPDVHRSRLQERQRGIAGWHETGDWQNVSRRQREFVAWPSDALVIDTMRPYAENISALLEYLG